MKSFVRRHKNEIAFFLVLTFLATALLFWALGLPTANRVADILSRFAFAILVALIVRLVTLIFSSVECKEDKYVSSAEEFRRALENARERILICQTWLPGGVMYTDRILNSKCKCIQVLLSSLDPRSHIHSRVRDRTDLVKYTIDELMTHIANCAKPLVQRYRSCVRFNAGHLPGWIAVLDNDVFWGPFPVDRDSHAWDFLFHKDSVQGVWGRFWKRQFDLLWTNAYEYSREKRDFNPKLF